MLIFWPSSNAAEEQGYHDGLPAHRFQTQTARFQTVWLTFRHKIPAFVSVGALPWPVTPDQIKHCAKQNWKWGTIMCQAPTKKIEQSDPTTRVINDQRFLSFWILPQWKRRRKAERRNSIKVLWNMTFGHRHWWYQSHTGDIPIIHPWCSNGMPHNRTTQDTNKVYRNMHPLIYHIHTLRLRSPFTGRKTNIANL